MASISLPALHLNPPPQPANPVDQYAQILQLRNMAENAPLQRQALEQQVQAGQLDIQQKQMANQQAQQAQQDQQVFRTTMQDPSMQGKTIGDVADTLARQGKLSQAGWMNLKKADLEQKTALAGYDDTQLKNAAAAHKQTQDLYNNVMNMPDDQLTKNWASVAQQYDAIPGNQKLPLDPNQPMTKQQLQQFGPMISMQEGYLANETAKREAAAKANREKGEADWYAQHGGAPGVPIEAVQQADWLQKNPGKTPSDYVVWKAQHSPTMMVQGMGVGSGTAGGGPMDVGATAQKYGYTPQAFDQAAEKYFQTGQLPPGTRAGSAIARNTDISNRAAELHPGESLAAGSAAYKANADSLKKMQDSFDAVTSFENTANKNIDMLKGLAAKVPDLGSKFANTPVRMISGNLIGSENMAAFRTALAPVQAESAKILNSANLQGQLSDSSRHELQDIVDGNLPYKSLVAGLNVLQQDFKNRHESMQQQITDIKGRLGGAPAAPANAPASTGGASSSDQFSQFGGRKH